MNESIMTISSSQIYPRNRAIRTKYSIFDIIPYNLDIKIAF